MNEWQEAEQHVERAHELYEAGRWDEAERALRQALELNPYQADWHLNLGLTLAAAGRARDAVAAFREAHELSDPTDTQPALELGAALLDLDRPAEAKKWLELVLERDSANVDAHVQLIDACAMMNEHEDAETHFYMALQIDPASGAAYSTMAESLMDRRAFDRAAWCLREAARLDPSLPRVNARLARTYAETGRLERARQLYIRELRSNPGDVETLIDLGRLLMDMNRVAEAGEKFRRALELEPDNADAHTGLGELAENAGDAASARQHYAIVVRLDPSYPGARRRLAGVLLDERGRGDAERARVLLREDLSETRRRVGAPDPMDLEELAGLLLDAALPDDAAGVAGMLVRLRPGDARAHHQLSVAEFSRGRVAAGIEAARRSVRLRSDFVPPMHNLAVAHLRRGEISRARYWVMRGLAVEPDDRGLRRLRAYLRVQAVRTGLSMLAMLFRGSRRA
ncbi:MAG: tetratricopeptide repeat protein [Phycisphaerales bacterium]